jgi:hypothetical protein
MSRPRGHSAAGRTKPIKNLKDPTEIEPATFRLGAQCLNQLRCRVPLYWCITSVIYYGLTVGRIYSSIENVRKPFLSVFDLSKKCFKTSKQTRCAENSHEAQFCMHPHFALRLMQSGKAFFQLFLQRTRECFVSVILMCVALFCVLWFQKLNSGVVSTGKQQLPSLNI